MIQIKIAPFPSDNREQALLCLTKHPDKWLSAGFVKRWVTSNTRHDRCYNTIMKHLKNMNKEGIITSKQVYDRVKIAKVVRIYFKYKN